MASTPHALTFDCHNSFELSLFWSQVTGYVEDPADPNLPEHPENFIGPPGSPDGMLFINVPEGKSVKNRLHLDLRPDADTTRDAEIERVIALGASMLNDLRKDDGTGFAVLADPEGNEFCITRGAHER